MPAQENKENKSPEYFKVRVFKQEQIKCDVRNQSANAHVLPLMLPGFIQPSGALCSLLLWGYWNARCTGKGINGKVTTQVHSSSALILFCLVTVGFQDRTDGLKEQLWCKWFFQKFGLFRVCNCFSWALPNAF